MDRFWSKGIYDMSTGKHWKAEAFWNALSWQNLPASAICWQRQGPWKRQWDATLKSSRDRWRTERFRCNLLLSWPKEVCSIGSTLVPSVAVKGSFLCNLVSHVFCVWLWLAFVLIPKHVDLRFFCCRCMIALLQIMTLGRLFSVILSQNVERARSTTRLTATFTMPGCQELHRAQKRTF